MLTLGERPAGPQQSGPTSRRPTPTGSASVRRRSPSGREAYPAATLALLGLTMASALGLLRVFTGHRWLGPVLVMAVGVHAVCWAARRARLPQLARPGVGLWRRCGCWPAGRFSARPRSTGCPPAAPRSKLWTSIASGARRLRFGRHADHPGHAASLLIAVLGHRPGRHPGRLGGLPVAVGALRRRPGLRLSSSSAARSARAPGRQLVPWLSKWPPSDLPAGPSGTEVGRADQAWFGNHRSGTGRWAIKAGGVESAPPPCWPPSPSLRPGHSPRDGRSSAGAEGFGGAGSGPRQVPNPVVDLHTRLLRSAIRRSSRCNARCRPTGASPRSTPSPARTGFRPTPTGASVSGCQAARRSRPAPGSSTSSSPSSSSTRSGCRTPSPPSRSRGPQRQLRPELGEPDHVPFHVRRADLLGRLLPVPVDPRRGRSCRPPPPFPSPTRCAATWNSRRRASEVYALARQHHGGQTTEYGKAVALQNFFLGPCVHLQPEPPGRRLRHRRPDQLPVRHPDRVLSAVRRRLRRPGPCHRSAHPAGRRLRDRDCHRAMATTRCSTPTPTPGRRCTSDPASAGCRSNPPRASSIRRPGLRPAREHRHRDRSDRTGRVAAADQANPSPGNTGSAAPGQAAPTTSHREAAPRPRLAPLAMAASGLGRHPLAGDRAARLGGRRGGLRRLRWSWRRWRVRDDPGALVLSHWADVRELLGWWGRPARAGRNRQGVRQPGRRRTGRGACESRRRGCREGFSAWRRWLRRQPSRPRSRRERAEEAGLVAREIHHRLFRSATGRQLLLWASIPRPRRQAPA